MSFLDKFNEITSQINKALDNSVNSFDTGKILDERRNKGTEQWQEQGAGEGVSPMAGGIGHTGLDGLGEVNPDRNQIIESGVPIKSDNKFMFTPDMILKDTPNVQPSSELNNGYGIPWNEGTYPSYPGQGEGTYPSYPGQGPAQTPQGQEPVQNTETGKVILDKDKLNKDPE